jgi:hypothetical protein
VREVYLALGGAAGIVILTACGGNGYNLTSIPPSNTQANSTLQFRVGTARFADGTVGLNTVVTFRQAGGVSATTSNTPTIAGPAGFTVPDNAQTDPPGGTKNTDVGTATISGGAAATTFGTSGGAFAYGFANANGLVLAGYSQFVGTVAPNNALYLDADSTIVSGSGKGNAENTIEPKALKATKMGAIGNAYTMPLYAPETNRLAYLLGPPAVTDFHTSAITSGFLGYDSGFTAFAAAPVTGTYALTVVAPATASQTAATFNQSASLTSASALPAVPLPAAITSTGDGGATFTVVAAPAGVTNQVLFVADVALASGAPTFYSFNAGAAGGTFTLSATSGPSAGVPFAAGDSVFAYVVGSDYDILAAAPPLDTETAPTLAAQTDVSFSPVREAIYPATGVTGPLSRRHN